MKADGINLPGEFQKLVHESRYVTPMKSGVIRLKYPISRKALGVLTVVEFCNPFDFSDFLVSFVLQCACEHNYLFASVHKLVFLFQCIFTLLWTLLLVCLLVFVFSNAGKKHVTSHMTQILYLPCFLGRNSQPQLREWQNKYFL